MNRPPYTVVTADQYVDMVPENWTPFLDIPIDFVILQSLCYEGRLKMKVREIVSPNGTSMGSQHLFRRVA